MKKQIRYVFMLLLLLSAVVLSPVKAEDDVEALYNKYNKRMAIALNRYRSTENLLYAYNMGMLGSILVDKNNVGFYDRKKGQRYLMDAAQICAKVAPYSDESGAVLHAALQFFYDSDMQKQAVVVAESLYDWLTFSVDSLSEVKRPARDVEEFRSKLYLALKVYSEASLSSQQQKQFYDLILLKKHNPCLADSYVITDSVAVNTCDGWEKVNSMLSGEQCVVEMVTFTHADTLCLAASCMEAGWKCPQNVTMHIDAGYLDAARLNKIMICKRIEYFENIWLPILTVLKSKQVFFVPDGVLHSLLLERAMMGTARYVCDVYELHRISTSLKMGKYNSPRAKTVFARACLMGYVDYGEGLSWQRLLGSAYEINDVYNIITGGGYNQVEAWRGMDCSEQHFRELQSLPVTLMHIATHGFITSRDSAKLSTGLILANANDAWTEWSKSKDESTPDDGILTSQELSAMRFPLLRLVVLSACRSGFAEDTDYNPVLLNALRQAGAQNVILSHWDVNDAATKMLMTEFYGNLVSKNVNLTQALQQAQRKLRTSTFEYSNGKSTANNGSDPYFWAPFILYEF